MRPEQFSSGNLLVLGGIVGLLTRFNEAGAIQLRKSWKP